MLPPFIPPGTLGPRSRPARAPPGPPPDPAKGPRRHGFCTRSLLISTFFNLVQIMKSNEKIMFLHFLLRSPVILLFLRYLIFQKNIFSMLVPIWDPLGPPKKSIDHFWHPLDAALAPEHASRTASGPSKNRSKQKVEWLKNTLGISLKS